MKGGKATREWKPPRDGSYSKAKPAGSKVSKSETDKAKSRTKRNHKTKTGTKYIKPTQRRVIDEGNKDETSCELVDSESDSE